MLVKLKFIFKKKKTEIKNDNFKLFLKVNVTKQYC